MASYAESTVNIMAPKSMAVALSKLARDYSRSTGTIVNTSFITPASQQKQINEGGAADILITTHTQWLEELKQQGLFDVHSQTRIASNRLVLVGPIDTPLSIDLYQGFPAEKIVTITGYEQSFVVANPETLEEGSYAKEALGALQVMDYLEPYTLFPRNLDQMFYLITQAKAYGVFYESSTADRRGVKVLSVFPEGSHKPIDYYAVVSAGDNMDVARDFLSYIKSKKAADIFVAQRFTVSQ